LEALGFERGGTCSVFKGRRPWGARHRKETWRGRDEHGVESELNTTEVGEWTDKAGPPAERERSRASGQGERGKKGKRPAAIGFG